MHAAEFRGVLHCNKEGVFPFMIVTGLVETDLYRAMKGRRLGGHAESICKGVAKGLADLHSFGVLHLDLKPSNVLLDSQLDARLCDFGLSQVNDPLFRSPLRVKSTPAYLAPEALFGTSNSAARLDSWAFGCLLYELLFGQSMFIRAKGLQQLGSMLHLIFEEQFKSMTLPETVRRNLIKDDPLLAEAAQQVKDNLSSV